MDNASNIRQKLFEISETMKDVSIETAKVVGLQSDLCVVKEELRGSVRKIQQLESEVIVVKEENKGLVRIVQHLESEVIVVKEENKGLVGKVQQLESEVKHLESEVIVAEEENKGLVKKVQHLESEVVELKSVNCEFDKQMTDLKNLNKAIIQRLSKVEKTLLYSQSSSVLASQSEESVAGAVRVSDCRPSQDSIASQVNVSHEAGSSTVSDEETRAMGSATIVKKPKAQRKREQEQMYKNFSKIMAGKKIQEKLWASGFLKMSVDQWEGSAGRMQPDELCDFVEKSIGKLASFASTSESRERLILTLLKICGDRAVPMEKLKEILDCFVKRGTIAENDVVRFVGMYKL